MCFILHFQKVAKIKQRFDLRDLGPDSSRIFGL